MKESMAPAERPNERGKRMSLQEAAREFLTRQREVPHVIHDLVRIPGVGRVMFSRDGGNAFGTMAFRTRLHADHISTRRPNVGYFERKHWKQRPDGRWERRRDLGSGLVTNIGAMALSNDWNLAAPSGAAINTLKLANQHATGTGVTAAAVLDYKLQTVSTQGGQTPVAGAQSFSVTGTMAVPILKTIATISYTGSEAVTEWGLFTSGTLSATTGTPFTTDTATSFTCTGTPFTASSSTVQGLQQQIVEPGTTTVLGLIASNTTSVATLVNNGTTGWWTKAAMTAGATPGTTEAYTLRPIMWDHKVFSAINVVSGDAIQFTYSLQINSGG